MRLFIITCLISLSAFGADWNELRVGKTYKLSQSFQLQQDERSGSFIDFNEGEKFRLEDIVSVTPPGATLSLFIFEYLNCPGHEMSTEMEIISVKGSSPLVEVGALLENCKVNMYIETKDLYSKSLFE